MQMPSVSAPMRRLTELFAGTWHGNEQLYPSKWDPKGGPATGRWTVKAGVDGFCLLVDYEESRDGRVDYRGHGVHSFDARDECFYVHWFDNLGVVPRSAVRATLDGETYSYRESSAAGHTPMTYAWNDGDFTFTIERSEDGERWSPMHEGRYRRA